MPNEIIELFLDIIHKTITQNNLVATIFILSKAATNITTNYNALPSQPREGELSSQYIISPIAQL